MTPKRFNTCKQDFLSTYQDILCEESLAAIHNAQTPEQFINLLHEFATFLHYKVIPTAEWVRKWFGKEQALINSCGVYLDQILFIKDPAVKSLVLMGKCNIKIAYTTTRINTISLQDESEVGLLMYGAAQCKVREKGIGKTQILLCSAPAKVKIYKI